MLEEYSGVDLAFSFKDTETADEILKFNNEISREINKIKSDEHEMQIIEQLRLQNKVEHETNIKITQNMYKKTRIDLLSKIKTLSKYIFQFYLIYVKLFKNYLYVYILDAQISILEDFKDKKQQLFEKFINNSKLIKENENIFKINLNEIDRKFKIAKEK